MSVPTKAQWADFWQNQTIWPTLGSSFHETAPLFGLFGFPTQNTNTAYKVNWTKGAVAGIVQTTAGAAQNASTDVAIVNEQFLVEHAVIGGQAADDIFTDVMGSGFEAARSLTEANEAIFRNWLRGVLGSGDGTDAAVWGFEDYITEAAGFGQTRSLDASTDTFSNDLLLSRIDSSITKLPKSGFNVCLTSENGYNALYRAIRNVGGTTPSDLAPDVFGFNGLLYRGTVFSWDQQLADDTASPANHSEFDFWNVGPSGVMPVSAQSGYFSLH